MQQCTPYSIPEVANAQASYPTLWETAKIPAADAEARALFESIEAELNRKLPNATPKPATGAPGSGYVSLNPRRPVCLVCLLSVCLAVCSRQRERRVGNMPGDQELRV